MPTDAPKVKLEATRGYGAEVVLYNASNEDRQKIAERLAAERGLTRDPAVRPPAHPRRPGHRGEGADRGRRARSTSCSCPAAAAGCFRAARSPRSTCRPSCRVIGVEPAAGDDGLRSFRSGKLETIKLPDTIADGARTTSLGKITFALIQKHVDDFLTVTDEELLKWMFFLWERMKIVVEPTGALAAARAAAGKDRREGQEGRRGDLRRQRRPRLGRAAAGALRQRCKTRSRLPLRRLGRVHRPVGERDQVVAALCVVRKHADADRAATPAPRRPRAKAAR